MVHYLFRRPKFPVICDAQGVLIGAKTSAQFAKQVGRMELAPGGRLPLVDVTAEGWVFLTDYMTVSPLTMEKTWTKKKVIDMFNKSETARQAGIEYSLRSLSSKRFDRVITEIVALIQDANPSSTGRAQRPRAGELFGWAKTRTTRK